MLDQTLDLFQHTPAPPAPAPSPTSSQAFDAWRTAEARAMSAEAEWLQRDARGYGFAEAGATLQDASQATRAALQRLIDAPMNSAADALAILTALAHSADLFGELAEQLGIDARDLPRRLARFVPPMPADFNA